jgi:hypothetical protein
VTGKLQTVHIRVNDAASGKPTPCRVRFTDAEGNCYVPFGRSTTFPRDLDHEIGGGISIGGKTFAYIDGICEILLPPGPIQVTITKGPEYKGVDRTVRLAPGKLALRFELNRHIDPAREGWHSGALAVTPLSPHEVLLEGAAEGFRVVDLLAFQHETTSGPPDQPETVIAYPNLLAFSGQRPCLETLDCLIAVNTLNGNRALGGLALLNSHRPVFPLEFGRSRSGAPSPDNWSLADWCDQCHRKGGLVIGLNVDWWEKWNGGEGLADLILGKIDAVGLGEMYVGSIQWWYTLHTIGVRVPIVAGIPTRPLGLISRTCARLQPDQEFDYANWIEALRAGRTAVSRGPYLTLTVDGNDPGTSVDLAAKDAIVRVRAEAKSLSEFHQLEIIHEGAVVLTQAPRTGDVFQAEIDAHVRVTQSGWLAARCTDRPQAGIQGLHAHTSAVYVRVDHQPPPVDPEAVRTVLELLDRTLAWVERDANCPTSKDRERLADVFLQAKQVLLGKVRS